MRADGRWAAYYNLGTQGGKRRRKYFYAHSRKEVTNKLAKAQRQNQTLGYFIDDWYKNSVAIRLKPKTRVSYQRQVYRYIIPNLGSIPLVVLSPYEVQELINKLSGMGLSPASVKLANSVLKCALGKAELWGLVNRNVAKMVDLPRARRHNFVPLSPEQARIFLAAAHGNRLEALYILAITLGIRQGEVLGLKWEDTDMETGTLRIRHALQRVDGKLELVEPKSECSRRTIHLPPISRNALLAHRSRQNNEKLRSGPKWQENGFIFATPIGTPMDSRNFYRRDFKPLLNKAGLPNIRFHDLRHTAATLFLNQGVSPRVVMDVLGHSQIAYTLNTYCHVSDQLQIDAMDKMDQIFQEEGVSERLKAYRGEVV